MQALDIEDVKAGMKVACRIRNSAGEIFVDSGQVMTEELIKRCSGLGVYTVHVLENPVQGANKSYDAAARLERVTYLFRNHQDNIFMKTMEAFVTRHFNERV